MRGALRWLAYPLVTGGAVVAGLLLLARGWPAWAIGAVVAAGSCVAAELLERLIPYSAAWSRPRGDWPTDAWHFVLSSRAVEVGAFVGISAFTPLGAWLEGWLGGSPWPATWPLAAQVALALALLELPNYWIHRLEHTRPLLWRLHAVHHSAERMYWWNFNRQHPLDNLLTALLSVAGVVLLGAGEAPLTLAAAFVTANGMLQHCNADLRTGALDLAFATPRVHRWHHSRRPEEALANYGGALTLWDHVFRTRRFPKDAAPPEDVGLAPTPAPFPTDFLGQLRSPFVARLWSA
jgi:sterol desaturase/sphingolipid hydroxylase (fatty acid hydroxylase superfamily)